MCMQQLMSPMRFHTSYIRSSSQGYQTQTRPAYGRSREIDSIASGVMDVKQFILIGRYHPQSKLLCTAGAHNESSLWLSQ